MPADDTHGIVFADSEGVIRFFSPGAERLFGHSAADAVGRSLDLIVPEPFRAQHWAGFRRAVSTGAAKNSGGRTNIPVLCRDGQIRPFPGSFYFLTDGHGIGIGAIAVYGDQVGGEEVFGAILPRPTRG
jgi:PAS domain S-box-containing protein